MDIEEFWNCIGCEKKFNIDIDSDKALFFQVDIINNDHMLLSNFYEQKYVLVPDKIININDPYCRECVNNMNGLYIESIPEESYVFKQNGYDCVNIDKQDSYRRNCGPCACCDTDQIMKSVRTWDKDINVYLLWTPELASMYFPETLKPKLYKCTTSLSIIDKPLVLCEKCFKTMNPIPLDGTISCAICHKLYQRDIYARATHPVMSGLDCECHIFPEDTNLIADGFIDPTFYHWTNEPLDINGYFCNSCLHQLIKDNVIKEESWSSCSEE